MCPSREPAESVSLVEQAQWRILRERPPRSKGLQRDSDTPANHPRCRRVLAYSRLSLSCMKISMGRSEREVPSGGGR